MKIGFFDSGLGGLTILSAVRARMPVYDYIFYGDTEHLPLGDKTETEIFELTKRGVEYLFEHGAVLVVIACNTASAETLRQLQETILTGMYRNRKILGVIIPTVETLLDTRVQDAVLIGTRRTIESQKYPKELAKRNATIALTSIATPELVPLIELRKYKEAFEILHSTHGTRIGEASALVLGCTHYTVLREMIRKEYPRLTVISQNEIIPEKLHEYLTKHSEIKERLTIGETEEIFVTGESVT